MSDTTRSRPAPASAPASRSQDAAICLQLFWIDRYCGPNRGSANDSTMPVGSAKPMA
jgi:hypothetical protein